MPHLLDTLLKTPEAMLARIQRDDQLPGLTLQLLFWGLLLHACYGFTMGLFGSTQVALMAAGKAPLIALCSAALCLPSFYVFCCVAGLPMRPTQACALTSVALGMTGLLLLGMLPVTWLFSVSTGSLPFVVLMNLTAWFIALGFAVRVLGRLEPERKRPALAGLGWWLAIYVLVSLQMTTTMRPLLVPPSEGWREPGKKFFLAHFGEAMASGALSRYDD